MTQAPRLSGGTIVLDGVPFQLLVLSHIIAEKLVSPPVVWEDPGISAMADPVFFTRRGICERVTMRVAIDEMEFADRARYRPMLYQKVTEGSSTAMEVHLGDGWGEFIPTHVRQERAPEKRQIIYDMEGDLNWMRTPSIYTSGNSVTDNRSSYTWGSSANITVNGSASIQGYLKAPEVVKEPTHQEWLDQRIAKVRALARVA